MSNLGRVKFRKYLTMFGIDAIEAQVLSEYFDLQTEVDTGNSTMDAWLTLLKVGGYITVGFATTYTTNRLIDKAFKDSEELAMYRDLNERQKMKQ